MQPIFTVNLTAGGGVTGGPERGGRRERDADPGNKPLMLSALAGHVLWRERRVQGPAQIRLIAALLLLAALAAPRATTVLADRSCLRGHERVVACAVARARPLPGPPLFVSRNRYRGIDVAWSYVCPGNERRIYLAAGMSTYSMPGMVGRETPGVGLLSRYPAATSGVGSITYRFPDIVRSFVLSVFVGSTEPHAARCRGHFDVFGFW